MIAPIRHTASTLALAAALCLGGGISLSTAALAQTPSPYNQADGVPAPSNVTSSALDDLANRLAIDSPNAARRALQDLSASPGTQRAGGLVAWTKQRIDLWENARSSGTPQEARLHARETLAGLEGLRGLQGATDLGLNQLVVLFNDAGTAKLTDPDANAVLGALAALLQSNGTRILITGYATDEEMKTGDKALPRTADLALERARFAAWRLRDLGVPADRIALSGQVDQTAEIMPIPGDPLPDPLGHRVELFLEDPAVASAPPPTAEGAPLVAQIPQSMTGVDSQK
ncbi:OmpA family protein [Rhodospirillum sp. A1_3_36]|uniref:OmpA family protein n=1 Tax=Rhodospirillum sp. A1_3_36 TaxID=3391666 RepID=UPI0039A4F63F